MTTNSKKYFLKVTNPQKGTHHFLKRIGEEFLLKFDEFWQKRDDSDIKLHTKPVYSKHFDHVVLLYSRERSYIEFAKYLIHNYINAVERLETSLHEIV
ncbi:MAG: hypothetical protein AB7V50_08505 [Vampirovibrionia bacterium]